MNMSKEQLKANYDVKFIGEETVSDGTQTFHLELTPKAAASYKVANLWIDKDGAPRQAKITERNNDTTTVLLKNIQTNVRIDPAIFKIKPAPGTTEVKA